MNPKYNKKMTFRCEFEDFLNKLIEKKFIDEGILLSKNNYLNHLIQKEYISQFVKKEKKN